MSNVDRSEEIRDPILDALGALPPVTASAAFTERVLARVRAPHDSPATAAFSRGWLLFATSLALVSVFAAWQWERRERRREWLGQVEAMRQETRSLGAELSALRAAERAPVVYLGGDETVDWILDLEPLQQNQAGAASPARIELPQYQPTFSGETL